MLISQIFKEISPEIANILRKGQQNEEITSNEALKLLKATGKEFLALQYVADQICREKTEDIVTFVKNRNINFTNICTKHCKFCSFNVSKNHPDAFLLSHDQIREKVMDAKEKGCTEVCIQGGINPEVDFEFYLEILRTVKKVDSNMHIHAFSPQEVFYMTSLNGGSLSSTLKELKKNGLDSMPGTAAEILDDNIRKIICPNKISVSQWIKIIKQAHKIGVPTTSTMMYGHIENLEHRIKHLRILRDIQRETNGITEFVPLPFVKENPKLSKLKKHPLIPSYGMADLKLYSVARVFLNNFRNIQTSWVKLGPKFAQVSLNYGVNDFSGTLMEENISRSAGGEFGQYLSSDEIVKIIKLAGKRPAERSTTYGILRYY
ncbi:MAG: 7,8-didemethyl-8-hydroxy-5-deazariboflavin synthase subunit CofH [Promethearchaeota archaeon]|nr:MAG: 7,8-didemethyl-8-hydroxy-5-deazariboflavin synthase subunit CofH [Candidatus Lokiarchaeota archaeon]